MTDWRSRRGAAADSGFTLIEAVAAIAVAALMLTAIAFAAIAGIHGSTEARINQQAGDVIETAFESARAQSYNNLVMSPATIDSTLTTANDPRLIASGCPNGGSLCISVPKDDGSGTVTESLDIQTGGYITQHIQTDTTGTNKVKFTVATYITSPSDEASATYKRVTVYVDWTAYGQKHEREASTYVTATTRGLPLPHFKLKPVGQTSYTYNTLPANPTFGFLLTNLGARDSFDFTSNNESLGWTYYIGPAGANSLDTSVDPVMTDSDGDLIRDTGAMDPNTAVTLWATRTVPTGTATGTSTVKFTASSVAQPTLGVGVSSQTQSTSVTYTTGVVTPTPTTTASSTPTPTPTATGSCAMVGSPVPSGTGYYLHNTTDGSAFPGTTWSTTQYPMQFSTIIPVATTLQNYSHEISNSGSPTGRNVAASTPSFTNTTPAQVAAWQYQVTNVAKKSSATFSGYTYVDIWAEPSSGLATDTVVLQGMVGYSHNNANNFSNKTSATAIATGSGCGSWREFVLAIPTTTITAGNNDYLEVLLFNAGTTDVRLAYDTTSATGYQAAVYWQQS